MTWTELMAAMLPVGTTLPDSKGISGAAWTIAPALLTPGTSTTVGPVPTGYDFQRDVLHWPHHNPVYISYIAFNASMDIRHGGTYDTFLAQTRQVLNSREVMSPQSFYDVAQVVLNFGSSIAGWQDQIDSWLPGIAQPDADLQGDSAAALRMMLQGLASQISVLGDDMGVDGGSNNLARLINAAGDGLANALATLSSDFETWAGSGARNSPWDVLNDTFAGVQPEPGPTWPDWLDWHENGNSGGPPSNLAMKTTLDVWIGKSASHDETAQFATKLDEQAKKAWADRLVRLDAYATKFATAVETAFKDVEAAFQVDVKSQFAPGPGPGPGPGIGPGPNITGPGPGPGPSIEEILKQLGLGPGPGPNVTGPGPGAYGPGPGANITGPGPGAYGPGPGAHGPGPGADITGPGPGAFGPGPGADITGPGPGAFGPGPGAFGPGPGAFGPGPDATGDDGLGNPSIVPGPGPGAYGPGPGATGPGVSKSVMRPGSGNLPEVDDVLGGPTPTGIGPGGGLGGGLGGAKNVSTPPSGLGTPTLGGGPGPGNSSYGDTGSLVRPLVGPDGQALRTPSGDIRTVPDGASVTPDGQVLDAAGDPLTGPDGNPQTAPPGSTLGDPEISTGNTGGLDLTSGGDTGGLDDWSGTPSLDTTTSHLGGPTANGTHDNSTGNPVVTPGPGQSPNIPSLTDFEHRAAALANTDGPTLPGPGPGTTHSGLGNPVLGGGSGGHSSSSYGPGPGTSHGGLGNPGFGSGGHSSSSYGPGPGPGHDGAGSNLFTAKGVDTSGTPSGSGSDLTFSGADGGAGSGASGGDTSGGPHGASTPIGPGPGMGMGPGPGGGASGGGVRGGGTGAPISSRSITEELSAGPGRAGSSGQSGMPMMPMSGGPGPGKDDKRRTSSTVVTEDNEEVWSTVNDETGRSLGR